MANNNVLALGLPGPFELMMILAVVGMPLVVIGIVVWVMRRSGPGPGPGDGGGGAL